MYGDATLLRAPAPAGLYVRVWALLVLLTGVTVGVSALDLKDLAVFAALLIASLKASLVLLYFMHLRHGARAHQAVMALALGLLAVFLALTFADVTYL